MLIALNYLGGCLGVLKDIFLLGQENVMDERVGVPIHRGDLLSGVVKIILYR
jgi:hypothetical protein